MSKIIGIVSPAALYETENSRQDVYKFGNNYSKRIYECGALPLGILPEDGRVSDKTLDHFDGFVVCGGTKTWPYHLQVTEYALRAGKPLLGICLGMQNIHRTFKTLDYMEEKGLEGRDIADCYEEYRAGRDNFLLKAAEGHSSEMFRGRENESKHPVKLTEDSKLARLLGKTDVCGGTFHHWCVDDPSKKLKVTGLAEDGTIEVIEYGEKILGVQFHPEIDRDLMVIFEDLCRMA